MIKRDEMDRDRFCRTFSHLHASGDLLTEVLEMTTRNDDKARTHAPRRILVLAVVVVLMLALAAAAYAADLFGMRALLIPDSDYISLTKPQAVPEGLDPSISERVDNSRDAWNEWSDWSNEYISANYAPPDVVKEYENAVITDNGDGTYTAELYDMRDGEWTLIETRAISQETVEVLNEWAERMSIPDSYGDYAWRYGVKDATMAAKLEEIAAKYDLDLLSDTSSAWSSDTTGITGEGFYTNEGLAELTAEFAGSDNIFAKTPVGFDKVYWYDDGTFCVSYYFDLLSTGERVLCYGYNSMYGTLSSGADVVSAEDDLTTFTTRLYKTQDGTEVTISSNGESAYVYVYLENSFFAEHIFGLEYGVELTDADINAIADMIVYSRIGK